MFIIGNKTLARYGWEGKEENHQRSMINESYNYEAWRYRDLYKTSKVTYNLIN